MTTKLTIYYTCGHKQAIHWAANFNSSRMRDGPCPCCANHQPGFRVRRGIPTNIVKKMKRSAAKA